MRHSRSKRDTAISRTEICGRPQLSCPSIWYHGTVRCPARCGHAWKLWYSICAAAFCVRTVLIPRVQWDHSRLFSNPYSLSHSRPRPRLQETRCLRLRCNSPSAIASPRFVHDEAEADDDCHTVSLNHVSVNTTNR